MKKLPIWKRVKYLKFKQEKTIIQSMKLLKWVKLRMRKNTSKLKKKYWNRLKNKKVNRILMQILLKIMN